MRAYWWYVRRLERDIFDKDKEFSTEELISQLENVSDCALKGVLPTSIDEKQILQRLLQEEIDKRIEQSVQGFWEEGYFYKTVDKDLMSPLSWCGKIEYTEGAIVNGGNLGIWGDEDRLSCPNYPYAVKLKPLEGARLGEGRIFGDAEVVDVQKTEDVYTDVDGLLEEILNTPDKAPPVFKYY